MSNFKHKENRGSLFRTDKKSDTDRDYSGTAKIGDRLWWISGWIQESQGGGKYLSLSFKPQDADADKPKKTAAGGSARRDFDDAVPF
jgi:hypothetical protein